MNNNTPEVNTKELCRREEYKICTIEGCAVQTRSRYAMYCERHYMRIRRRGIIEKHKPPETLEHSNGYVLSYAPDHPLTKRHTGIREYQHRIVYYDANGEGPFNCHWCNVQVSWNEMHVDHVNTIRDDNRIDNLVASCPDCNRGWRAKDSIRKTMQDRYGTWIEFKGQRKLLADWAGAIGITRASLKWRIEMGWTLERAITEKRGKFGPKRNTVLLV